MVEYFWLRWVSDALSLGRAPSHGSGVTTKGADMLAWLLWQLERMERIHAVACALMTRFGAEAYAEARRCEREANHRATARDWSRVALAVARQTSRLGSAGKLTGPRSDEPRTFRIQFVCGTVDRGPTNLTEKQIQAPDAPGAIIVAANIKWPPQTIGVRILDREGLEVFARQRAQGRRESHPLPSSG
jgi:hypothetical protein